MVEGQAWLSGTQLTKHFAGWGQKHTHILFFSFFSSGWKLLIRFELEVFQGREESVAL